MGSSEKEIKCVGMIYSSPACPLSTECLYIFPIYGALTRSQGSEDFQAKGNEIGMKNELLISAELTQMAKRRKNKWQF